MSVTREAAARQKRLEKPHVPQKDKRFKRIMLVDMRSSAVRPSAAHCGREQQGGVSSLRFPPAAQDGFPAALPHWQEPQPQLPLPRCATAR